MTRLRDTYLWSLVSRSVTPLGQPRGSAPARLERVSEPNTVDLHGLTVQQAYQRVQHVLAHRNTTSVLFITGRSGEICREFPEWIMQHERVRTMTPQNSGGAFRVTLRGPSADT